MSHEFFLFPKYGWRRGLERRTSEENILAGGRKAVDKSS
jgi:hypothetical protein